MIRDLDPGMGVAVAQRTVLRKKSDGEWESWGDVAERVALGNSLLTSLTPHEKDQDREFQLLRKHLRKGALLMSGRHLQHGDETQPFKTQELFTNCSTAPSTFALFYLLLNGSGVGRAYDDAVMVIDYDYSPNLLCVLDEGHADFKYGAHIGRRDALHHYRASDNIVWHEVVDSREGWAKACEKYETLTFEKVHKDKLLVLDFSKVRPFGSPIAGMQDRPASGPAPLMDAFQRVAALKGAKLPLWLQAMIADHYFAACVIFGGARRAARMSTKHWRDQTILDFIHIKRPIEFIGKEPEEIAEIRSTANPYGFLWSSNNSVTVDGDFWRFISLSEKDPEYALPEAEHARNVFRELALCAYHDGTGEPGIINQHKLDQKRDGVDVFVKGEFIGSDRYRVDDDTKKMLSHIAEKTIALENFMITNPCGEIALFMLSGFCVIADVVPFFSDSLDEAEEAFRAAARALIRVNCMDSIYAQEVERTNRIGVGMTGIHEFAWKFFGYGFRDLLDEEKSKDFWLALNRFNKAVHEEATAYSERIGKTVPHTMTTMKPAGTTSKLFGLTEGSHLPSMRYYLRWVQFRHDDPLVEEYRQKGYPSRDLQQYAGMTIIGFPTAPLITTLGMGERLVTASEATPDEQYQWIKLLEKYWIDGVDEEGVRKSGYGNSISYTLKYKPSLVSFEDFCQMLKEHQSQVKCCSVMPQEDVVSYEYQPEEPISEERFLEIKANIVEHLQEDVDKVHVDCVGGACPVDFYKEVATAA